jgi:hypothetical protein
VHADTPTPGSPQRTQERTTGEGTGDYGDVSHPRRQVCVETGSGDGRGGEKDHAHEKAVEDRKEAFHEQVMAK